MQASIRRYRREDRPAVRVIYGMDEFARPKLLEKYPRYAEYLADEMSYYPDFEPESLFVAEVDGQVVGALLGAVNTSNFEQVYRSKIRWRLVWRGLSGAYGWPGWLTAVLRTEWENRKVNAPKVNRDVYPAHLHIGVLPAFRRQGLGSEMMAKYAGYLQSCSIPGYHLYASSFHPIGVAFYRKLGLELFGQFEWRLHTGFEWLNVTELIFTKQV